MRPVAQTANLPPEHKAARAAGVNSTTSQPLSQPTGKRIPGTIQAIHDRGAAPLRHNVLDGSVGQLYKVRPGLVHLVP